MPPSRQPGLPQQPPPDRIRSGKKRVDHRGLLRRFVLRMFSREAERHTSTNRFPRGKSCAMSYGNSLHTENHSASRVKYSTANCHARGAMGKEVSSFEFSSFQFFAVSSGSQLPAGSLGERTCELRIFRETSQPIRVPSGDLALETGNSKLGTSSPVCRLCAASVYF